jgi:hypothetical protein
LASIALSVLHPVGIGLQILNLMTAPVPSPRAKMMLLLGGILLFGVFCFFTGRLSVRQTASALDAKATLGPATNAGGSLETAAVPTGDGTRNQPAAPSSGAWDDTQWSQLLAQPGTPARNAALTALLEKLAAVDPDRAMALAAAEGNLKLRENLVQASLRGWARLSPTNAAAWALALPDANARETALSSVFAGLVAADPAQAVSLGKTLIQQHPDEALGCGSRLVDALCAAGNFEAAVQLASGGNKQQRSFWLAGAYSKWAEYQPEQAAAAAAALTDPELRNEALHGIVGGWAEADPVALVQFATELPPEADRGPILSQALQYWVKQDALAASEWLNSHEPGPEMDEGVAAVATMESVKPDLAAGWADSIINPNLRSETLATVLRTWMTEDPSAARQYFEGTSDLLPDDRQQIAEALTMITGQPAEP